MALKRFRDLQVGKKIKEIRTGILGMSQEELGAWLEYSQDTVAKWEKGQVPPALILKRIAERSKKSVDSILGLPNAEGRNILDYDNLNQTQRELFDGVLRVTDEAQKHGRTEMISYLVQELNLLVEAVRGQYGTPHIPRDKTAEAIEKTLAPTKLSRSQNRRRN